MSVRAWEPDPTGRHQYRWWDGEKWTDQVANNGVQTTDPTSISETLSPPHTPQAASPPVTTDTSTDTSTVGPTGKKIRPAYVASPWARLGARLFDGLLFFIPIFIIVLLFGSEENEENIFTTEGANFGFALITLAVVFVYEVSMIATKGQTLGKMVAGIKVVRNADHALPSWGQAIGRWALPNVIGVIPFLIFFPLLCYLSLFWGGPLRRGWHDKVAKTVVIKAR